MHPAKKIVVILVLLIGTICVTAQKTTTVQKFKPPKVTTVLGKYADSAFISPAEAAQLIGTALKITDSKNNSFVISSYQFAYKRITVSEIEETGKTYSSNDMVASLFKITPLPPLWLENIKSNIQRGEMFYFFDITVKDGQGRLFFAPDLKIYIR